jgi:hypothetical protein
MKAVHPITTIRDRMAMSVLLMGRLFWPALFTSDSPVFHEEIAHIYQSLKYQRINIKAPRGGAKSSLTQLLVLWHLFFEDLYRYLVGLDSTYTPRPKLVVICSETQDLAIRLLRGLKGVMERSQKFREFFGSPLTADNSVYWREHEIAFRHEGVIKAIVCKGMGQTIRGIREDESRVTLLITDDLESENNTKTPESMSNNLDWLLSAADYSVDDHKGRVVNLATPQNGVCICMKLEEGLDRSTYRRTKAGGRAGKAPTGWMNLTYSAIVDMGEGTERSLWPSKWTLAFLIKQREEKRAIGKLSLFMRDKQCIPTGDSESPFPPETHGSYIGEFFLVGAFAYLKITHMGHPDKKSGWSPDKLQEPIILPVNTFLGCDPAIGKSRRASNSVVMPIAVDSNDRKYVLPYWVGKGKKPSILVHRFIHEYGRYGVRWGRIEDVGFQELLARDLNRIRPDLVVKTYKKPIPMQMEMDFANRRYFLPFQGADLLRYELTSYPFGTMDAISALYGAQHARYGPTHSYQGQGETKKPEPFDPLLYENYMTV